MYRQTVRNQTMLFCVMWVAIGTVAHRVGFIGAFLYLPIIYLAFKIDSVRREVEGDDDV